MGFLRVMSEFFLSPGERWGDADDFSPLNTEDVAQSAVYMLSLPPHLSVKALDVVSTGLLSVPSVYAC